jgi:putative nucleotidyltransferase with HDIG domain
VTGKAAVTLSIGVAASAPGDDPNSIIERAKRAFAAAQRLGGNQVRAGADDALLFNDRPLDTERFELIVALAKLVDGREGSDPKHSHAVASLAAQIALEMGLDADAVSRTYIAGLLHDLGKLALPEVMLHKPGPLDEREWEEMVRHSSLGASLVEQISAVCDAAPIVAAHHERWDGAGYPNRLSGERIPAEARVVAVADAVVAMTSERPYRAARSITSALTTIWRDSEKRYDPAVVSALLALARDGRLKLEEPEAAAGSLVHLRRA